MKVCLVSQLNKDCKSSHQGHVHEAMERLGWDVFWLNPIMSLKKQIIKQRMPIPDMILVMEGGNEYYYTYFDELRDIRIPKVFWCLDSYVIYNIQKDLCQHIKPDYLFVATPEWRDRFKQDGYKAMWMPYCGDPNYHKPMDVEIKNDIVMVGGLNRKFNANRYDMLNYLASNGLKVDVHSSDDIGEGHTFEYTNHKPILEEYSRIVSTGKMIINVPKDKGLTMRIFESQLMMRPVLTEWFYGLEELFQNKVDGIIKFCKEDLLDLAKYYSYNFDECVRIAENGRNECLDYHTYEKRMLQIKDVIEGRDPKIYWEM